MLLDNLLVSCKGLIWLRGPVLQHHLLLTASHLPLSLSVTVIYVHLMVMDTCWGERVVGRLLWWEWWTVWCETLKPHIVRVSYTAEAFLPFCYLRASSLPYLYTPWSSTLPTLSHIDWFRMRWLLSRKGNSGVKELERKRDRNKLRSVLAYKEEMFEALGFANQVGFWAQLPKAIVWYPARTSQRTSTRHSSSIRLLWKEYVN